MASVGKHWRTCDRWVFAALFLFLRPLNSSIEIMVERELSSERLVALKICFGFAKRYRSLVLVVCGAQEC